MIANDSARQAILSDTNFDNQVSTDGLAYRILLGWSRNVYYQNGFR